MFPHLRASLITCKIEIRSTGHGKKTEKGRPSLVLNAFIEEERRSEKREHDHTF